MKVINVLGLVYGLALVASWIAMGRAPREAPLPPGRSAVELAARGSDGSTVPDADPVRVAYLDLGPGAGTKAEAGDGGTPLLLLHGSPGSVRDFRSMQGPLSAGRRVLVPDLPGFGASHWHVPDYSVRAHAGYVLALMDELDVEHVDVVGFSMGGGVALELAAVVPERVRSLTLLASIGVLELELLGDHDLNHGLHVLQVAALRFARYALPHFGALDRAFVSLPYGRNFADTDQRRLRPILESLRAPTLILHGEDDFLVPAAAAREHARIVPQARLVVFDPPAHHFLPWMQTERVLREIEGFLADVEAGVAPTRGAAEPARAARAGEPFDPRDVPPFEGPALLTILVLLGLATFISEDLACIGAGLLVADGRISMVAASLACFVGIFVGDMLLYFAGRVFGRPALRWRAMRWFVSEAAVDRASHWFDRKGIAVIFLSRFTPGLRLPTYVAAGILRTSLARFALFFAIAGLLWTPALVGIAALAGERLSAALGGLGARQLPWLVALVLTLLAAYRTLPLLFTHGGRRRLRGAWLRRTRWEFWPPWLTYLPILPWIVWLGIRHRGLMKVTAVNPALPAGGFVGESKAEILAGLGPEHSEIPAFALLRAADDPAERVARALAFVGEGGAAELPVVLKPNAGQRGSGVSLVRTPGALERLAGALDLDSILQERIDGEEFGVFWVHEPGQERGRVFSVTVKVLPEVVGDGQRTIEELLLDDPRACALHATYLEELGDDADLVLEPGVRRRLVEVGTHARGAVFLDGAHLITPDLEATITRIAGRFEGFDFGRFDIRAPSAAHLSRGEGLRVIELNGVTSESTNVYDPAISLLGAYRVLWRQWTIAYRIGARNAAAGAPTTSLASILRELARYRTQQKAHVRLPNENLNGA